jgi:UDP-N-acetylmuramoyl-L-alanyl-D-glutamate--2,6-diaminopimelate ligase
MKLIRLSELLHCIKTRKIIGDSTAVIEGIAYDSRNTAKNFAFFAMEGLHTDGHNYIEQAIGRGASVIFHSRKIAAHQEGITYVLVDDTRAVLSSFSSAYYEEPSKHIKVIGVTGTDGKSSTVFFIHQLLRAAGISSGYLSTVEYDSGKGKQKNPYRQSTPEAPEIHRILKQMVDNGLACAVIEATSHGLSGQTKRLEDVEFSGALMTNISHEHLEFHGTFEQYLADKVSLLKRLENNSDRFAIVNRSDSHAAEFERATGCRLFSYGIDGSEADLSAARIDKRKKGYRFTVKDRLNAETFETSIPLPGRFNIENSLAALLTVSLISEKKPQAIAPHLSGLKGVPGRLSQIDLGQPYRVLIDYAHTPGAFEKLLPQMREETEGRLIVVFGSAGERDVQKRSIQGEIAARYADIIILTEEDPRNEDNQKILEEIAVGCRKQQQGTKVDSKIDANTLHIIPDRSEAIKQALHLGKKNDTIIMLGKGHESSIIRADGPIPWDETEFTKGHLNELGYGKK